MASSSTAVQAEAFPDGTKDYVPLRKKNYDIKKPHITDQPITVKNWYQHVNWLNTFFILVIPMCGLISSYWVPLRWQTAAFTVAYYFFAGLGITAGYHRLWAHTSYKATLPLRIFLAAGGSAAVQGSARWWSSGHRSHHRYTDTEKDPYSVRKGLLYSHIGWMVMKQNPRKIGRTDITDLNEDPVVVWQHKNYLKAVVTMALVVPTVICGYFWGDYLGGFVYAGILRIFFVQQATFCVNSLAHWLGDQPFDDRNSPRDHVITALVTLGEGYHKYVHNRIPHPLNIGN
jgi:stearoyl-CoA desaturase (delta-9 desaturase)